MSKLRTKTVEPVLGTLINFLGMKRVNTRGIEQAGKHVLMVALCYNLKKYLKFVARKVKVGAQRMEIPVANTGFSFFDFLSLIFLRYKPAYF